MSFLLRLAISAGRNRSLFWRNLSRPRLILVSEVKWHKEILNQAIEPTSPALQGEKSMMQQPQWPFCQSCAMPMNSAEMFGTNTDGSRTQEFCKYCFQNGMFTAPNITVQEMIDKCVSIMSQQKIMPEDQARELMAKTIPNLNRWKRA